MPNAAKPTDAEIPGPPKNVTGSTDSTTEKPLIDESEISGSMHTEEPTGWDQAPQSIKETRHKRHPRPDGTGGDTPAKGDDRASDHI